MSGALASAITLDDVLAVAAQKRIPVAPELAGYLALEIAEGADDASGAIDPRSVFIGEEGTVAIVKRPGEALGDAEVSIRAILTKLLEASGTETPALGAASRRKSGAGLRGLSGELEAALIPVNRAAGRRMLARVAREVKRVRLGVGRNATPPPPERQRVPLSSPRPADVAPSSVAEPPSSVSKPDSTPPPPPPAPPVPERIDISELPEIKPPPLSPLPSDPPVPAPAETPLDALRNVEVHDLPPLAEQITPQPATPKPDQVAALVASFEVSKADEDVVRNELKAVAGLEPTPSPATQRQPTRPEAPAQVADGSDAGADIPIDTDSGPPAVAELRPLAHVVDAPPPSTRREAALEAPRAEHDSSEDARPENDSLPRPVPAPPAATGAASSARGDRFVALLAVLALVAGAAALWLLRPALFSGRSGDPGEAPSSNAAQAPSCRATLVVTDVPAHAEVLLGVGQAPVDVERMPVGTRLEFVALAEGFQPRRAVVPAGAAWERGKEGKPRYELGVQLDPGKQGPQGAIWPAAEPGSEVGGKGPPGTVHIVASPKGAELWLLAGVGPEARIDQLRCDADVEVLVAGPTTLRKRLRAAAADFSAGAQKDKSTGAELRTVRVSASAGL